MYKININLLNLYSSINFNFPSYLIINRIHIDITYFITLTYISTSFTLVYVLFPPLTRYPVTP